MATVRNELCYREDARVLDSYETSKWQVISTFEDNMDVSRFRSGYDVAVALGDVLKRHLQNPQNPVGVVRIIGGPAYTYGQTSATATIFFEGKLMSMQNECMRVCSRCEWVGDKLVV